jgi:hypothetical protein
MHRPRFLTVLCLHFRAHPFDTLGCEEILTDWI